MRMERSAPSLYRFRAELRSGWRSLAASALIFGLALGASLSAFAGAQRTASVFERFADATRSEDVLVLPEGVVGLRTLTAERLESLPGAAIASAVSGFYAVLPDRQSIPVATLTFTDAAAMNTISVPVVREGRLPDPTDANEVFATPAALAYIPARVGEQFDLIVWPEVNAERLAEWEADGTIEQIFDSEPGVLRTFTLVGVGLLTESVATPDSATMYFTKAFHDETQAGPIYGGALVKLEDGSDVAAFERDVVALIPGEQVSFQTTDATQAGARRILRPQVLALLAFGVVMAVAAFAAWGQAAARRSRQTTSDDLVLETLGMTARERRLVELIRTVLINVGAATVAVTVASAVSTRMPIGEAHRIEPTRGFDLDVPIVIGGAVIATFVGIALGVGLSKRSVRSARPARRTSLVTRTVHDLSASPSLSMGVANALEPAAGRLATPTRSTLVGATAGILVVALVTTFATNLRQFVDDPHRFGWGYDAAIDVGEVTEEGGNRVLDELRAQFAADPDVAGWGTALILQTVIDGQPEPVMGLGYEDGAPFGPTLVAGRLPASAGEVALGERTARSLGVDVGDRVTVGQSADAGELSVVGIVVLPGLPTNATDGAALGGGALLTLDGTAAVFGIDDPAFRGATVVVDLVDGASTTAFAERVMASSTAGPGAEEMTITGPGLPAVDGSPVASPEVVAYRKVVSTPVALAAALALIAALSVGFALVAAVRRHRRDFGTLQALGFTPRQVRLAVGWHAATVAIIAAAIGVPCGVIAGRQAWVGAARQIGVPEQASIPWSFVLFAPLVALLAANLVAVLPARAAATTSPSVSLRDE